MAKQYQGSVAFANGFSYSSAVPMDDRSVVPSYSDMINPETWKKNGVFYIYQGMTVTISETGEQYVFLPVKATDNNIKDKSSWSNPTDWEEV